jgi:hypothetical protein
VSCASASKKQTTTFFTLAAAAGRSQVKTAFYSSYFASLALRTTGIMSEINILSIIARIFNALQLEALHSKTGFPGCI